MQPAARPDVDAIFGIPPTVAIEQRTSRGGRKSTVATLTEIYHFLRLLYVKLGTQHCPDCDVPIEPQSAESHRRAAAAATTRQAHRAARAAGRGAQGLLHRARRSGPRARATGSCASTARCCRRTSGRGSTASRSTRSSCRSPSCSVAAERDAMLRERSAARARFRQGRRARARARRARAKVAGRSRTKRACPVLRHAASPSSIRGCSPSTPSTAGARTASAPACRSTGFDEEQSGEEIWWNEWLEGASPRLRRLRRPAAQPRRAARALPRSLDRRAHALSRRRCRWSSVAKLKLDGRESGDRARPPGRDRGRGSRFLDDVGLGYLALDRSAPTLSGGEAQRIRLAAQLGSNLQGVCYVLDEPTIGLHPRDNACCSTRWRSSRPRATRWSSSSTTRTRSGAPITSSISVRAPACAAARSSAQGTRRGAHAHARDRSPAASSRRRCRIRSQPRRAVQRARDRDALVIECARCTTSQSVRRRAFRSAARRRHRRVGLGQVARWRATCSTRTCARLVASERARKRRSSIGCSAIAAGSRSSACWKSTRRRSARRRAPVRPPTSVSGTTSASCIADTTEARMRGLHGEPLLVQHGRRPLHGVRRARACRRSR